MRVRNGASADERLRFHGWTVTPFGCWEWNGSRHPEGYGRLRCDGRLQNAHRVAFETWVRPLEPGEIVRHKVCDNPPCINPEHLLPGTRGDNNRDREERGRGRQPKGADHGGAILSDTDIPKIRERYDSGDLPTVIAREYGIHRTTASKIGRRKLWRHVA